jgi:Uncharacterized protein conserved in archaea
MALKFDLEKLNSRLAHLMAWTGCLLLSACGPSKQTNLQVNELSQQVAQQENHVEALTTEVSRLRKGLDKQFESICEAQQKKHVDRLNARTRQLDDLKKEHQKIVRRCEGNQTSGTQLEGKLLLGEIENVTLIDEETLLSARIDTGADTSSLGVYKQKLFERDGRQWVRFALTDKKGAATYEYRIRGRASIKQNAVEGEERVEVRMDIKIGGKTYKRQIFNLADRSYLEHQVLIGRSFLTDIAVVDTSAKYLLGKK